MNDDAPSPLRRLWRNLRGRPQAIALPPVDAEAAQDLAARLHAAGIRKLGRGLSTKRSPKRSRS